MKLLLCFLKIIILLFLNSCASVKITKDSWQHTFGGFGRQFDSADIEIKGADGSGIKVKIIGSRTDILLVKEAIEAMELERLEDRIRDDKLKDDEPKPEIPK